MKAVLLGLVLSVGAMVVPSSVRAQEPALEVNADAIKVTLERQNGKRVRLRLLSGHEIEGTVVAVGTAAVHVARLGGGLDFFDGVIRLDQIAAVVVRVRSN